MAPIVAALLCTGAVRAQDTGRVVSDRPGFYEGTATVTPGRLQFEGGVTYGGDWGGDDRAWSLPQATLRLGLVEWGEVFVDLPSWNWFETEGDSEEGWSDALVGFKARLWENEGARPAVTLIGEMGLPTGDGLFSQDDVSPRGIVSASWDLGEGFGLVVNGALGSFGGDGDRFGLGSAAVALEIPIAENVGAFVEYFGLYPWSGGGTPEHYVDGGFTFLVGPRLQLDVNAGVGLNDAAGDFFVGAGIAILF